MQTGHNVLKWVIAIISAAIGGFFGLSGGSVGAIVGVISGLLVGYYYVHFTLKIRSRHILLHILLRILLGTLNGTLAGLISGISVHIPSLFIQQRHGLFGSGGGAISTGATFGVVIGTIFGFIGACIIASIPREKESE